MDGVGFDQCGQSLIADAQDAPEANCCDFASRDHPADVAIADTEHVRDVPGGMPAVLVGGMHTVTVVVVRTTGTLWEGILGGLVIQLVRKYLIFQRGGGTPYAGGKLFFPPGGLLRRWV